MNTQVQVLHKLTWRIKTLLNEYHELALLKAVKQAGNANTLGKANIFLEKWKELKSITHKRYIAY